MASRKHRPPAASDREGPPGAIPVLSYDELMRELPRGTLASALLTALRFHKPEWVPRIGEQVCQCRDKGGNRPLWPCPEAHAIIAVLAGEQAAA